MIGFSVHETDSYANQNELCAGMSSGYVYLHFQYGRLKLKKNLKWAGSGENLPSDIFY